ncbi:alpha-amylase [filamentous cyanobacterium LEGE 11480]|uniref:Alpha-amylase n=1 Tax=Romeriopsis navalis LEGE 11480 TaxID=2777977 RepID=A0A928VLQ5_9CYAN|nr:glucosylglycerol hydrolase [Romeriopsis navalis]MBE9030038.1 alpha-amylase [Romeriopsis navalis LEGE 11480]
MPEKFMIRLVEDETAVLVSDVKAIAVSKQNYLDRSRQLVRRLGAHYREDGLTEVGFWVPELAGQIIQSQRDIYLEVFTPIDDIDFRRPEQIVEFQYDAVPMVQQGEFVWGVVEGMHAGTPDKAGSFYWLRYRDNLYDQLNKVRDIVPYSLPYGVFAPAELYDVRQMQRTRKDLDYFRRWAQSAQVTEGESAPRVKAPVNILQIHVGTASAEGTLEALTKTYQRISDKLENHEPLTAAEQNYIGYDAVQLLPTEPTIEYRVEDVDWERDFFEIDRSLFGDKGTHVPTVPVQAILRKPNTQNWGYDIPLLGGSTTNPAILGSLRPHEMIDFIATLHNFSQGPIDVIFDLVYGHADNQALQLMTAQCFQGPNMYGQDVSHQHPIVRSILLEMHRRKINTGVDGIRVDGGQDFRFFNPLSGDIEYDDGYLFAMSDIVQKIHGCERLLFTIFEDGRPWPQKGWEEKSTYRDLIEQRPDSYQWGPLIFAHNTPTLKGFWNIKWKRVTEVMYQGDRWITGCGNHDTVRRGNQIDVDADINWNLGETLPEVLKNAYDNPATNLWVYGFSPGLPMDFINVLMHAAWGFFRNTDERYGVKVVSEEKGFLDWQVNPAHYGETHLFTQLKALGFDSYDQLVEFLVILNRGMTETEYDIEKVIVLCQTELAEADGSELFKRFIQYLDVPLIRQFAMAFMEDKHEYCRVCHYADELDPQLTKYNYQLRQYRRKNSWLRNNLSGLDRFNRLTEGDRTIFVGIRNNSQNGFPATKQVALIAHMGGESVIATPGDWLQLDLENWKVVIASPGLAIESIEDVKSIELHDGQGILLEAAC